ncbi:MAG: NAD(P)-dependent oxidoreductase [Oscillochloris sp.]|nr:NAD(P)-dependent oxidoreductase [Oscillochloris sp.]
MQITVLGLGLMGRPIARTLARAGHPVRGWNRSPLDAELRQGIVLCSDLRQAAEAEICLLMLAHSAATDAVLAQLEPHLRPQTTVVDMGSSDPARSQIHAERLANQGIAWVDAPVSGGPEGAAAGKLAIMAGGSAEAVAQVRTALEALGRLTHVGGAGAGHTAKVINQLIVGLSIQAVAEATALAEAHGVAPHLLRAALAGGFADSKILQIHGERMASRRYIPGGRVATQLKDLRLAAKLATSAGLDLPHLNDTLARYEQLLAAGHGDLDHSALHLLLDQGSVGA